MLNEHPELKYTYDIQPSVSGDTALCRFLYMPYITGAYDSGLPAGSHTVSSLRSAKVMAQSMIDGTERLSIAITAPTLSVADLQRALMQAGLANEAAVSQMEAAYYQVKNSVLDLEEQINQVKTSRSTLLAETPRDYQRGTLQEQQFPTDFSVGVPVQLLSGRPDVRSAERALEAAFYTTNAARSAFYPSITLSGSAGWTNSAGSMIVNPGKVLATAVASLTQPLFAQGKLTAQLKIAKAQQEQASLSFQQALLNAGAEVNDALSGYQTSHAKSDLLSKQVEAQQKALRSTSLLMEHGNTTYLEVLTARQSLLAAQLSQTANRFSEIQSLITLYQALGGGQE